MTMGHFTRREVVAQDFLYTVQVRVKLAAAVVERLSELSAAHYDGRCKALSERGGMVYGWMTRVRAEREFRDADRGYRPPPDTVEIEVVLGFGELDTLCKVLEGEAYMKTAGAEYGPVFRELLSRVKAEQARVGLEDVT